jgi:hypothetical protein
LEHPATQAEEADSFDGEVAQATGNPHDSSATQARHNKTGHDGTQWRNVFAEQVLG